VFDIMINALPYMRVAVDRVLKRRGIDAIGHAFVGGLTSHLPLRPTQREALTAYGIFLSDSRTTEENKKTGYFELPTGIGKTGIFVALIHEAHLEATKKKKKFRSVIVVPTTQLLDQTYDEFVAHAPDMAHQIGRYGDRHRTLSKPVTIITYDSWINLTEQGKISRKNVDLLISDEAHRGTSERRVDQLFQAYGRNTVQLAFTATAHFDEEKSVQQTHKNEIFYKGLPESVKSGELAEYIHSQLYIIRVEPLSDGDLRKNNPNWKSDLRRQAWNQRILKIFSDGIDHVSGDLLSDNQAGFFVADTSHADQLELMANQDSKLLKKARKLGKKKIAVAIHSNLAPSEQRKRLAAFMRGEYMAVIGDEKFKEGFNYPALKNIFDYPRGSLVDKAQIAGRAARKWWNVDKQRSEGMSFIDTVVYVGSNDKDQDKSNREIALRRAVLVSSILDGTEVFSEKFETAATKSKRAKDSLATSRPKIFAETDTVEEYATLEDIKNIHAQINYLRRNDVVEITEPFRLSLGEQMKQKEMGAKALIQSLGADCPDDLTASMIDTWQTGVVKTARSEHWNAVIDLLMNQPDAKPIRNISKEDRQWLITQTARTEFGPKAIMKALRADYISDTLDHQKIECWRRGSTKIARTEDWNAVKDFLENCPDAKKGPDKQEISDKDHAWLNAQFVRAGIGTAAVIVLMGDNAPDGLKFNQIESWKSRRIKTARCDYWNAVKNVLVALPNAKVTQAISEADRQWLDKQMDRTKLGDTAIMHAVRKSLKADFSRGRIDGWRDGSVKTAQTDHWEAVKTFLLSQEDAKPVRHLSEKDILWLNSKCQSIGLAAKTIITALGDNLPSDLSHEKIGTWQRGNCQTARDDHWNAVVQLLEGYKPLHQQYVRRLEKLQTTTGYKIKDAFAQAGEVLPSRLQVRGFLSGIFTGETKMIHKDDLPAIAKVYATFLP
jgi:superfamily II DNA or RNA helicase